MGVRRRANRWKRVAVVLLILSAAGIGWWLAKTTPPGSQAGEGSSTAPATEPFQDGPGSVLRQASSFDAGGEVVSVAVSHDGYLLGWGLGTRGGGVTVEQIEGKGRRVHFRPVGFTAETSGAAFIDNQTLLAAMGESVYVCSMKTRVATPLKLYKPEEGVPLSVAGMWGGGLVRMAVGLSSGVVELSDVQMSEGMGLVEGKPIVVAGHKGPVRTVKFFGNGRYVGSASEDGTLRVIHAGDGRLVTSQPIGDASQSLDVLSGATGDLWVGASGGTGAVVWAPHSWDVAHRVGEGVHQSAVTRMAFSRGGLLATGSADAIVVWSMEGGKVAAAARAARPHGGMAVGGLVFSNDGETLISGGADGQIRRWVVGR